MGSGLGKVKGKACEEAGALTPEMSVEAADGGEATLHECVLDNLDDYVTIHDLSGRILYANRRARALYLSGGEGQIALTCEMLFHKQDDHCPHATVLDQRKGAYYEGEYNGVRLGTRVRPLENRKGEVVGFTREAREVRDQVRLEDLLTQAERYATVGQIVAGLAHDIGTPLNIISGYTEYLLLRVGQDQSGKRELTTILQQTRRIADMMKSIVDLARPSQGRRDAIGLERFVAEIMNLMHYRSRKRNVEISFSVENDAPILYGELPRLSQAFFNLIANAVDELGPGGKLHIDVAGVGGGIRWSFAGVEAGGEEHNYGSLAAELRQEGGVKPNRLGISLVRSILEEYGGVVAEADGGGKELRLQTSTGLPRSN